MIELSSVGKWNIETVSMFSGTKLSSSLPLPNLYIGKDHLPIIHSRVNNH